MSPNTLGYKGSGILIGLEVVNGKLVRQGLENFARDIPEVGRLRIYKAMQRVYNRLGIYPAQRPGQRYRHRQEGRHGRRAKRGTFIHMYKRTYQLRDRRRLIKLDLGYMIENDPVSPQGSHYAVFVRGNVGGEGQTPQNKDWLRLAEILNIELQQFPQEVLQALSVVLAQEAAKTRTGGR